MGFNALLEGSSMSDEISSTIEEIIKKNLREIIIENKPYTIPFPLGEVTVRYLSNREMFEAIKEARSLDFYNILNENEKIILENLMMVEKAIVECKVEGKRVEYNSLSDALKEVIASSVLASWVILRNMLRDQAKLRDFLGEKGDQL